MLAGSLVAVGAMVWYVVLVVGVLLLLVLAIRGNWFVRINTFLSEVRAELKKVSWPSKEELRSATGVVIVSTALVTLYVVFIDFVLDRLRWLLFRLF
jgi:preprotein translocase subunit SecE